MNQDKFNTLNEKDQKIWVQGFEEGAKVVVDVLNEEDQELRAFFKKQGLVIIEPSEIDMNAFQKVTSKMPDKYKKYWIRYGDDLHKKIQNM
jgi:TRAP-type C4-dicarboxylate transport system substrate-binding protein